jgi:hypothetical protein
MVTSTLKKEAVNASETLLHAHKTANHHTPEYRNKRTGIGIHT